MINPIIRIIYGIAFSLIFVSIWILWPSKLDMGIVDESTEDSITIPDYSMKRFRYASVRGEKRELEIFADAAIFHLERQEANGSTIIAYFYNKDGEITKLVGDKGIFYLDKRHLHLTGNVHSLSPDGFALEGNSVDYFSETKVLAASEPVYGYTRENNLRIWANRAESKLETNFVNFWGDVRTEYNTFRQGLLKIRGDRAELDRLQKFTTYYDNVKAQQEKMDMTSSEASLYYAEEKQNSQNEKTKLKAKDQNAVKYLVARKDVTIRETTDRFSQSQMAEFFADTNSIVLTGFPSVYEGKDAITGEKLTLYRSTGVVEVTAANAAFSEKEHVEKKLSKEELSGEDLELVVEESEKK